MNNLKKIIFVLILSIIIVAILLITILLIQLNNENKFNNDEYEQILEVPNEPYKVNDRVYYDTVNTCINIYLNILNKNNTNYYGYNDNNEYTLLTSEEEIRHNIYNTLSEEYIRKNNITIENVQRYVYNINEQVTFIPLEMFVLEKENIGQYKVHGIIQSQLSYKSLGEVHLIVNLDYNNRTFSIEPISNVDKIEDIQMINNGTKIEKNDNNIYEYKNINSETIAREYITIYKRLALGSPERAYNILDKEYREARFENLEDYKVYIDQNREKIESITLAAYQTTQEDGYTQYVIMDRQGNYYIFRETAVMNYTVILDQYTIDLPEYIEKYNKSKEQEKVALCINKFIQAINAKDYKYAYSKLADSFKQNYFTTQESFEKYAKENFFEKNKISLKNFGNQATIYTYETVIANEDKSRVKAQSFVVNLKEGTDFEMSFQVE